MYKEKPDELLGERELVAEGQEQQREHRAEEQTERRPTHETLQQQRRLATATFERELDAEQVELERILLQEGIELKPEELEQLYEAIPELCKGISPELAACLQDLSPRLTALMEETAELNMQNRSADALKKTIEFLENEQKAIEKIPDPAIRDTMMAYITAALNIEELSQKIKDQAKLEALWGGIGIIPVIGSSVDIASAARGKTPTGETLNSRQRVWHATKGTAFLVADVAGIVSWGASTAGSGAAKAVTAAEASGKSALVAKTVLKFANICHKVKNLSAISKTIAKVGKLMNKYPRMAKAVMRAIDLKKKYQKISLGVEMAKIGGKTALSYGKSKRVKSFRPQKVGTAHDTDSLAA